MTSKVRKPEITLLLRNAVAAHQQGRLGEADIAYAAILARTPDDAEVLHYAGIIKGQIGKPQEAIQLLAHAVALDSSQAGPYLNLGNALRAAGKGADAVAAFRRAIALAPRLLPAHLGLGAGLLALGNAADAVEAYRHALKLDPGLADAHFGLGNALAESGSFGDAAAAFRQTVLRRPEFNRAWVNLGRVLEAVGQPAEAEDAYRKALALKTDDAATLVRLAYLLEASARFHDAFWLWRDAARLAPQHDEPWQGLVRCLSGLRFANAEPTLAPDLLALLNHPAVDSAAVSGALASYCKAMPAIARLIATSNADPSGDAIGSALAPGGAFDDPLICRLLECAIVADPDFERLLAAARRAALDQIAAGGPPALAMRFLTALAQQIFTTEYIYPETARESEQVSALAEAVGRDLDSDRPPSAAALAVLAAYRPLHTLQSADKLVAIFSTSDLARIIGMQITEPRMEMGIRPTIVRLTPISDEVSRDVRDQYEENPYPRWRTIDWRGPPAALANEVLRLFPDAPATSGGEGPIDMLVAGCGTGRHSIGSAKRFKNVRVLAVDLSLTSLAYAVRATRELGLDNIEYAQADILELGGLGRQFDLVESGGVLHHLRDPFAGWRILTDMLRPGGYMRVALYSVRARATLDEARALIDARGYRATAADIRRFRHDLLTHAPASTTARLVENPDFYTVSGCRDLLFHVEEHRFTLFQIADMLKRLGLRFLGFEFADRTILERYRRRFPDDPTASSLANWDRFEAEHPGLFVAMYQFWTQKPAN